MTRPETVSTYNQATDDACHVLWDLYILFQTVMVVFKGAQS